MNKHIEAEGNELVMTNNYGDTIIIPKNRRSEALKHINDGNNGAIDNIASILPYMADYAEDGSLIVNDNVGPTIEAAKLLGNNQKSYNEVNIENSLHDVMKSYDRMKAKENDFSFTKDMLGENTTVIPDYAANTDKNKAINKTNSRNSFRKKLNEFNTKNQNAKFKEALVNDNYDKYTIGKNDNIKQKQMELLNGGFYEDSIIKNIDNLSSSEIIKVQKKVGLKGSDLDGDIGPITRNAVANYNENLIKKESDGIIGKRTKKAISAKNANLSLISNKKNNEMNRKGREEFYSEESKNSRLFGQIQTDIKDPEEAIQGIDIYDYDDIDDFKYTKNGSIEITSDPTKEYKYNNKECTGKKGECAGHVTKNLTEKYGIPSFTGDAWTYFKYTGKNKAGNELYSNSYNLFDWKRPDFNGDKKSIKDGISAAFKKQTPEDQAKLTNLPALSIVNMYYPGSASHEKAYKEGNSTIGTHAGFIEIINGKKFVNHEINGNTILTPLQDAIKGSSNGGMRIIAAKAYNEFDNVTSSHSYTDGSIKDLKGVNRTTSIGSKESNLYYETALDYASQIGGASGMSIENIKNMSRAMTLIGHSESSLGKAKLEGGKGNNSVYRDIIEAMSGEEYSKGVMQFKDETNLSENTRKNLNINNETLLAKGQAGLKTGMKAAAIKLTRNYKMISEIVRDNSDINLTNQEVWQLATQGYNQNIDNVSATLKKYKTIEGMNDAYVKQAAANGDEYKGYSAANNMGVISWDDKIYEQEPDPITESSNNNVNITNSNQNKSEPIVKRDDFQKDGDWGSINPSNINVDSYTSKSNTIDGARDLARKDLGDNEEFIWTDMHGNTRKYSTSMKRTIKGTRKLSDENIGGGVVSASRAKATGGVSGKNVIRPTGVNSTKNLEIDLTKGSMSAARTGEASNGNLIIGGEFIESNESAKTALEFKKYETERYGSRGRTVKMDDGQEFYSVVDGALKIGLVNEFNDDQVIVPVRWGGKYNTEYDKNTSMPGYKSKLAGAEMQIAIEVDEYNKSIGSASRNTVSYSRAIASIKNKIYKGAGIKKPGNDAFLDGNFNKMYDNAVNGKVILYDKSTGAQKLLYGFSKNNLKKKAEEFKESNPNASFLIIDNGRYNHMVENKKGLTDSDFRKYSSGDLKNKRGSGYNLIYSYPTK